MPGRGGLRVPLPRYIQPDGQWGYIIGSSHPGNGYSHNLVNWAKHPTHFEARPVDKSLSDMNELMRAHCRANYAETVLAGSPGFRDWKGLWGRHKDEVLVIASCGPSLTESLPWLYANRPKFRLMTINRSHRAFQDAEARPDYHYFVERRALPDWCFETENQSGRPMAPLDMRGVTMIGTPQCDPRLAGLFEPDRRYWGWSSLGGLGDIGEARALASYDVGAGTTIGNAPYIAWKLGFKRIVLVGCDFSLDCRMVGDGTGARLESRRMYFDRMWNHTHYTCGTPEGEAEFLKRLNPMLGHDGTACMSNAVLLGWCDYFKAVLDIAQYEAGMECVNATPRGILDWNCKTLEEAVCG